MQPSTQDPLPMIKIYRKLFIALTVLTVIGIFFAYTHTPLWVLVSVSFALIALKANAVISAFKHLIEARKFILVLFGLTGIFFLSLLVLPILNQINSLKGSVDISKEMMLREKPSAGTHGH